MSRLARAGAALLLYAGLVAWLTWPLASHISTHLPAPRPWVAFDALYMGWVLTWESHALTTAPSHLFDANIYFPARHTLFYGDTGFGALPYFMPIFLATGNPTLALNLTLLGCLVLTAWTLHLVVERWTGSALAGFVAAWCLLTTRWILWDFVPSAPSYSVLQYFPPIILLAATPARRFREALRLLPLVVLQCLTDVVYVASAVLAPLGILALGRIVRRTTRAAGVRLLLVLGLAVLALVPVYLGHLAVRLANPALTGQTLWPRPNLPTLLPWGPLVFGPTAVAKIALLLIVAGGIGFLVRTRGRPTSAERTPWMHASFWAIVGMLISMTPRAYWHQTMISLPHLLVFERLGIYSVVREPERLGVAALMGLTILCGLAFAECLRWLPRALRGPRLAPLVGSGMALVVASLVYAEYARTLPRSYPLLEAIGPGSPLLRILEKPGGPLLEVPVEPAASTHTTDWPRFHAQAMYRSIFHWRPLLNGYNSFWPDGFRERMALANRLPDPDALADLRRQTGLEMILVHTHELSAEQSAAWRALAEGGGRDDVLFIAADGDDLLFRVAAPRAAAGLLAD